MADPIPLTVLMGVTASGKSAVALALAARTGAEIVSVDSMQVYRRMDIGTAKPTPAEQAAIRHHLIDVVEPSESFSAARYVELADAAVADMAARGVAVLAVGGTALYLKALTEGLFEGPAADPDFRRRLRARAAAEGHAPLHAELARVDPESAARIHPNDYRRIERALEVFALAGTPISRLQRQFGRPRPRYRCAFFCLRRELPAESRRINARVKWMIEHGLVEEVRGLLADPAGLAREPRQALGYAQIIEHLAGRCTLDEAVEQIKIATRRFAKHQRTWFRRFPNVRWLDLAEDEPAEKTAERMPPLL